MFARDNVEINLVEIKWNLEGFPWPSKEGERERKCHGVTLLREFFHRTDERSPQERNDALSCSFVNYFLRVCADVARTKEERERKRERERGRDGGG